MLFVDAKFQIAFAENDIYDPGNYPAKKDQNQPAILQAKVKSKQQGKIII
jgi:hypothetical protein